MHKLVEYICDELEELERKAEKEGKLSMAEVQYMDTLAHAKKNLLKGEEMMEESEYSMDGNMPYNMSMARGRGRNAKRDAMGRYSSEYGQGGRGNRGGQSYRDMSYGRMSYDDGMKEMVDSIYNIMDDLPEDAKRDAQKLVKKIEQTM